MSSPCARREVGHQVGRLLAVVAEPAQIVGGQLIGGDAQPARRARKPSGHPLHLLERVGGCDDGRLDVSYQRVGAGGLVGGERRLRLAAELPGGGTQPGHVELALVEGEDGWRCSNDATPNPAAPAGSRSRRPGVGVWGSDPGLAIRGGQRPVREDLGMDNRGWQTHWHKHPGVRSGDQLTLGERAADRMRNMMGSWPFVFAFFTIMILWAVVNSVFYLGGSHGKHGFDPYPYILLNLFLSMLAGVQAAALLIAAKRADAISSEIAVHTEKNTDDLKGLVNHNTALTEQVKKNTDLLQEIHRHVSALSPAAGRLPPDTGVAPA